MKFDWLTRWALGRVAELTPLEQREKMNAFERPDLGIGFVLERMPRDPGLADMRRMLRSVVAFCAWAMLNEDRWIGGVAEPVEDSL